MFILKCKNSFYVCIEAGVLKQGTESKDVSARDEAENLCISLWPYSYLTDPSP